MNKKIQLRILRALVYEEEDFQPVQYGYHLNPDISESRMIGMLKEVEEDLNKRLRLNLTNVKYRFSLSNPLKMLLF